MQFSLFANTILQKYIMQKNVIAYCNIKIIKRLGNAIEVKRKKVIAKEGKKRTI